MNDIWTTKVLKNSIYTIIGHKIVKSRTVGGNEEYEHNYYKGISEGILNYNKLQ